MNTVPSSRQPSKPVESGELALDFSIEAEDASPPTFLGRHVSELLSQLHSMLRDQAGLTVQPKIAERARISLFSIATDDHYDLFLPTEASREQDEESLILPRHLAALRSITVPHEHFPKCISNAPLAKQFAENTVRWLQLANTAYSERGSVMTTFRDPGGRSRRSPTGVLTESKRLGIFYPQDYQAHQLGGLSISSLLGVHSLPKHFDRGYKNSFVANGQGYTPSECLSAFFHGPTIADCATTLMACLYRAIEATVGTDEFNRLFDSPVSKFRIARCLFQDSDVKPEGLQNTARHLNPIDCINPIYDLFHDLRYLKQDSFDPIREGLSESAIKKGDILYIQGVDTYTAKHKSGNDLGFNLICTGQNSSRQNLYLGFDPDGFAEPKTYDQVKNILIDGYNKPQSSETTSAIKGGETSYAELTNHILPYDHSIVGITHALRFSTMRWDYFASLYDKAWHQQPLSSVAPAVEPKSVDHGSPFPSENLDADFDHFEPSSPQQELMKLTALKFTHAVINSQDGALHQKPMGLFLTGSPGIGKTHLCVAVAKKAAEYGLNTLYIDEVKAASLFEGFAGSKTQWNRKIDEMLAGKDLVVVDDANHELGRTREFLAKIMTHVMTNNKAVMASSNHLMAIQNLVPGIIDPLTKDAHNFFYLSDLQGESCRSQWWQSPEVKAADALSQLGQYQGCKAAAVIIEDTAFIDDIARLLDIPVAQIRRVGHYFLPGIEYLSPEFFFSDLSKTEHQAVFMECHIADDGSKKGYVIEQFLNVMQRVYDEGLKLVVKTNNRQQLVDAALGFLDEREYLKRNKPRIIDRLKHMFPDFS